MAEDFDIYLEFLRYAISDDLPEPESIARIDWRKLLTFAQEQTIVGIYFYGMNKLSPQGVNRPDKFVVAAWLANNELNKAQNIQVNRDAVKLMEYFEQKGNIQTCLLKGQGNAMMYPDPFMRSSGDIDLWCNVETLELLRFVKAVQKEVAIEYHHVDFSSMTKSPAEVHFFPSFMGNLFHEYRLRKYFNKVKSEQFKQKVELPGGVGEITVPTDSFNRIFQISHVMHHFFFEGVGLRQLIDYYYLLKRGFTAEEKANETKLLKHLGMYKFTSGLMWVLHETLGLDNRYLLVEPNEEIGKMLLDEVLLAGNFGHHDDRYAFKGKSAYQQYFVEIYRNLHYAHQFPSETIFGRPISRWWHMIYKAYLRRKLKQL